jgi:predicted dehydrogenase/nucleoside-diphosphate-sugar epimerase
VPVFLSVEHRHRMSMQFTTVEDRVATAGDKPVDGSAVNGPLRVLLLGAGKMANHHAVAIQRLGGIAKVVGVADSSAEALASISAQVPDAAMEREADRILGDIDADVAHICTPPAHHSAMARAALEAGLHVYVEKPFALNEAEASEVLALAADRGLHVCAGHQLLLERPSRMARKLVYALGPMVHVESYFAFRQVRSWRAGRPAPSAEAQLIDILPHPVYLLLAFLGDAAPDNPVALEHVKIGRGGTVHALLRCGDVTGTLVVTLTGRPVESYVRLVGMNGALHADYVRGTVQRAIGPGASGIDKALAPYRLAKQLLGGTTESLGRRVLRRQKSYPGLAELFEAFYDSIRVGAPPPMTPASILDTVRVCQQIAGHLQHPEVSEGALESGAEASPRVLVTGGTGFLGRQVLRELQQQRIPARSVARRSPPAWDRRPGVDYLEADLAEGLSAEALHGIEVVIHCAAETSGGWDAHERNSVGATEKILTAAADVGVRNVVYISSVAVLAGPDPLTETSPLETGEAAGPYVWGKAQAERRARALGTELGLKVTILRPGAIVDWRQFDPPGKLGRRLGNLFVAVGSGNDTLGVVDVVDVARVAVWAALSGDEAPDVLNVVDPDLPDKRHLVRHLRQSNPGLRVVWVPRGILWPLSWMAIGLQKFLRPTVPAVNVAKVFARRAYDPGAALRIRQQIARGKRLNAAAPEEIESDASPAGSH